MKNLRIKVHVKACGEGKDSQKQSSEIQFTNLVLRSASINYCSFYLFIYVFIYLTLANLILSVCLLVYLFNLLNDDFNSSYFTNGLFNIFSSSSYIPSNGEY
jgi:hypothetical protein